MSDGASANLPQAIVDAFNDHDLDRIMAFFADDCGLEMPTGPSPFERWPWGEETMNRRKPFPAPPHGAILPT